MTLEATVTDLVNATTALHDAVRDKKTVLDNAAQQAAASLTATQSKQAEATASAAAAAASAATATSQAAEITAFKTAATALNTSTTATQAVTNLLPDMLAKKDPARHPFRKKMPTLVLDFERQKCHRYAPGSGFGETALSSFMTFARNSTATYTGPDGLIKTAAANEARYDYDPLTGECKGLLVEEQRTNLILYSRQFLSPVWATLRDCVISPMSTLTPFGDVLAHKIQVGINSPTQVNIGAGVNLTVGTQYCASAVVKAGNTAKVSLAIGRGPSSWRTDFELGVSTNATHLGNGWYLISVLCPAADGTNGSVNIYPGNRLYNTPGEFIYVAGAQLEAGSFPTSYIPTPATFTGRASTATYLDSNGVLQTAASGVARSNAYDYDSDGVLRPIGLLLEASATNQLLYSEQFDNAVWGKFNLGLGALPVVTANYGTAPDGQTTADRVVFALNGGTTIDDHSELRQSQTTVAGSTYTQSVWLKTTDASTKVLQLSFNGENPKLITVTGTWQRFSNTGVASDTIRGFHLALRGTTGTSDSADLLVWGAQQGVGNYPTSYIATTSAQVTRAADTSTSAQATRVADDAKVDGVNFSNFYNQTQGTLVARGISAPILTAPFTQTMCVFTDETNNNRFDLSKGTSSTKIAATSIIGGVTTAAMIAEVDTQPTSVVVAAARIAKDNMAMSPSGAAVLSDTSTLLPVVTTLRVGSRSGSSAMWNGHVSRISYYPQPFTNEELQAATSA